VQQVMMDASTGYCPNSHISCLNSLLSRHLDYQIQLQVSMIFLGRRNILEGGDAARSGVRKVTKTALWSFNPERLIIAIWKISSLHIVQVRPEGLSEMNKTILVII
jgi:hypothetical protein